MEFDLERFYRINRRVLMWVLFFLLLYLLRSFFTLVFLTFVLGFVGRQVANALVRHLRISYRLAVVTPYVIFLAVISVFLALALPRLVTEAQSFVDERLPELYAGWARFKAAHPQIDRLVEERVAPLREAEKKAKAVPVDVIATGTRPAGAPFEDPEAERQERDKQSVRLLIASYVGPIPELVSDFVISVVSVALNFLLAILLSFLILLDYTRVREEVVHWRDSSVGAFFEETASSVVNFAAVVGRAFQCQFYVATLNAALTLLGLLILDIGPVLLLTSIVFMFGFIPVLGVFVSSVPIILIALNTGGLAKGLWALGMIVLVHLAEAYVFNPRIYAARFHINPVITLIILLIAHRLFGVWGMLLGIPVTHYALTLAIQIPTPAKKGGLGNRKHKHSTSAPPARVPPEGGATGTPAANPDDTATGTAV